MSTIFLVMSMDVCNRILPRLLLQSIIHGRSILFTTRHQEAVKAGETTEIAVIFFIVTKSVFSVVLKFSSAGKDNIGRCS